MSQRRKKQKRAGQGGGAVPSLSCIEPNAAEIDVGASEIFVAVPQDRDPSQVRSFETLYRGSAPAEKLATAMWHHYRSHGVHRSVLDSAVSDFREGGHGSVSGECPTC